MRGPRRPGTGLRYLVRRITLLEERRGDEMGRGEKRRGEERRRNAII
jgi:hypothetical protein